MYRLANALADANARIQFYQVVDPNKSLASDRDSEEMLVSSLLMYRLANALADANARTQFYQVVDPNIMPLQLS